MAEPEHEVDEKSKSQDMAVLEEGAATPHGDDAKAVAQSTHPRNRRLFAALLTCLVIALVAAGVWAIRAAGGSAALTTVAQDGVEVADGKTDATQGSSDGLSEQKVSEREASSDLERRDSASSQPQPAQPEQPAQSPAPVSEPASEPTPASQVPPASDPAVTTTVVETPETTPTAPTVSDPPPTSPAPAVQAVSESASEGSESMSTAEPEPATRPAPASEPTSMTILVSIDGTPAGGGYRDATVTLSPGASAYDALLATGAGVNARGSVYGTYVAAIDGLAEKDHGGMSGWVYAVNGVEPQTACSNYKLSDGDVVAWLYVNAEY